MSMPTYSLNCDRCNFVVNSSRLWGKRLYRDAEGEFRCRAQFGWCRDCADMVPMEDFDYIGWELEEIRIHADWLKSELCSPWQALWNLLFPGRRRRHRQWLDEIRLNARAIEHARKRRGTERCLECGSRQVKPFDGEVNVDIADDSTVFEGQSGTGFVHPGCGGELIANGNGLRLNIALTTRWYTPEGELIE